MVCWEWNPLVTGRFPPQRVSDAGLWSLFCCKPEQADKQTIELPVTWDAWTFKTMSCWQENKGWFNMKTTSYQYRNSPYGDNTILRPSYLHNAISYIGKTTSIYWIRSQITIRLSCYIWSKLSSVSTFRQLSIPRGYNIQSFHNR